MSWKNINLLDVIVLLIGVWVFSELEVMSLIVGIILIFISLSKIIKDDVSERGGEQ